MATAVRNWNARARTGQSVSRVLFVTVTFVALLISAAMLGYKLVTPEKPIPHEPYRGVVQLAPDERGQCQRFDFDNRTGRLRPQTDTWCRDEASVPADTHTSPGPFRGVRDYFNSR
jgi:hypothetical protein